MIQTNFEKALVKGSFAEDIIKNLMESKGFVVYRPVTHGAHAFDMMAIKNKKKVVALDVKAKARRTYYQDTGINLKHFYEYLDFAKQHNVEFWLLFIDEYEMKIYGNNLQKLQEPKIINGKEYPLIQNTRNGTQIIYWPLVNMITISVITDIQAQELKTMSQRNFEY